MSRSLREVQEERGNLQLKIRELADKEDSWQVEDRQAWEEVNARYDEVMEELDALQLQKEIAERRIQTEEDEKRLSAPPRGLRNTFSPRPAGPTPEQRALSLQAWICYANGLDVSQEMQNAAAECRFNYRQQTLDLTVNLRSPLQGYEMFSTQGGRLDWRGFENRRKDMRQFEQRQMNTGTPTEGAEFVPELFQYELERAMLAYGGFRRISRILPTAGGNPLMWPTVDDTGNVATIVGENTDIGSHTGPTTGNIQFGAYKYSSAPCLVTAELLEDSAFNMAALLGSLLGERLGRGQAIHLATGDGTTQPQGCVTGASDGHTAGSGTAITGDDLIDLQGSLDPAYEGLPSIGFAMNKATLTAIRKLTLTDNQYIWQPGLQLGVPDLVLGAPYAVIQEMPDIGLSAVPVLYGAFEKFVIREVATMRMYRLEELYRANDNTGFVALHRVDSKVIQPAAIKKLTMAAA